MRLAKALLSDNDRDFLDVAQKFRVINHSAVTRLMIVTLMVILLIYFHINMYTSVLFNINDMDEIRIYFELF